MAPIRFQHFFPYAIRKAADAHRELLYEQSPQVGSSHQTSPCILKCIAKGNVQTVLKPNMTISRQLVTLIATLTKKRDGSHISFPSCGFAYRLVQRISKSFHHDILPAFWRKKSQKRSAVSSALSPFRRRRKNNERIV